MSKSKSRGKKENDLIAQGFQHYCFVFPITMMIEWINRDPNQKPNSRLLKLIEQDMENKEEN
jgi:hypothetical protein